MMKKKNILLITVYILFLFVIGSMGAYAVTYLYNGKEVGYSNTKSGLSATNVQNAIDEVYPYAVKYKELKNMAHPVGSIYVTVEDDTVAEVQARFGGTWEVFGSGRTLVGVNTSDTDFNTEEKTGGSKSQDYTPAGTNAGTAITVAQMPSHNHTYAKANANTGSTTLTAAQSGLPAHNHGITKNASFTVGGLNGAGTSVIPNNVSGWGGVSKAHWTTISVNNSSTANASQGHTHSMGTSSANTGNQGSGNTHTHTFTGTKASISHLQPYVTVYMYKRVS